MAKSYRKDIHGVEPYYDDYDPQKKFVRILSRPGFPLQAREVTQLQTIIQDQIERFADHLFEDGASIRGGEITEARAYAIRLADTSYTTDQLDLFLNKTVTNANGVKAKIVSYADASQTLATDSHQVFFVTYTTAGSFVENDVLTIEGTLPVEQVTIISSKTYAVTLASNVICINKGIFYTDGFFVENDTQTFAAYNDGASYRDFDSPTCSIGFRVTRDVVTSDDDDTLKDPSFGFYNFNSPGADRYRIRLTLTQIELANANDPIDDEDYIELIRIVDGLTTKKVRYTDYAIFEDTLARRTFDESGNYTVRPFQVIPVAADANRGDNVNTQHAIKIGSGKAYILGYEFETIAPTYFPIDRALTINTLYNQRLVSPLTNYVSILRSSSYDSTYDGERLTFIQNKKGIVQKVDGDTVTDLGTCNIRSIEEVDGELRLYLFNINMTATGEGNGFANSTHIALDDGSASDNIQRYRIGTVDTDTELKSVGSSRQIFKSPLGSGLITLKGSGGLRSDFLVKKPYQFTIAEGADSVTITSTKQFLDGVSRNHVIFYGTDTTTGATALNIGSDVVLNISNSTSTSSLTITIPEGSGITGNGKGTLIASQKWSSDDTINGNIRTKTLTSANMGSKTGDIDTGIVYLDHADVYSITSISDATRDVTDSFDLDVNSGVDCYRRSRLVLRAGATCGTDENGDILVSSASYQYFSHSGEGPFTVDSYPISDTFTYDDIPVFTDTETGESYSLADAFDFRPVTIDQNETGFNNGSGGAQVVAFENGVSISTVSYKHYLSRIDRVVLGGNRDFKVVKGIPAIFPKSPEVSQNDMVLGDLILKPYTRTEDDIRFRYIDNQRTTMKEINENEKTQQYDQFFIFRNDLEQEALNRAANFRSSRTAFSDGIFVDTFIGHNNAVTVKRDHNCSIDPEYGECRPAFESQFYSMGASGASLGSQVTLTDDGIYMVTGAGATYTSNDLASDTIDPNQFSVPDFLGTLHLTPSSDNYFSVLKKPRVIVNTVGEVDNWEHAINAYQRGRTRGFGSQWRDWETLWFGSTKRNDTTNTHEPDGLEYTTPRRSSYVSRIISDKVIRRVGNKIVDLSVVPYIRSRTIEFEATNLKPSTRHEVYFDGVLKTAVTSNANGGLTGSFIIESSTYLTGEKLVRVTDRSTISLATSSADAIYYAQGLLTTQEGDIASVRPAITRRKASNVEDVTTDYYDSNSKENLSASYNSQTPFAQEIFVDPSRYQNGIMLKSVELFFASKPTDESLPVKVSVRPMFNGAPHPFKVLPFSETTVNNADITVTNADAAQGTGTTFTFSTPIYLKPNTSYAICVTTNSSDYLLWYGKNGDKALSGAYGNTSTKTTTVTKPVYMNALHVPLNNGSSYQATDDYLKMSVVKENFIQSINPTTRQVTFNTSASASRPYHVLFVHGNEQPTDIVKPTYTLTTLNANGGESTRTININTTIDDFENKKVIDDSGTDASVRLQTLLTVDSTASVCAMVDKERLGCLAVEYMANNDDSAAQVEELNATARLATNRSRYVSRKVTLEKEADDIVVMVDGSYIGNSQIKVYVKLQGSDQPNGVFDDNPWEELYPEGDAGAGSSVSARFAELKPQGPIGGIMRFTTDNLLPGTATKFTAYQLKVLIMGENVANGGNSMQIPVLNAISAVPLRRISQDEIRRYTPAGTVLSWAGGGNAPYGFVYCDGTEYDYVENPEYKVLFQAIGYTYGGTAGGPKFKVPDLRSRTIVGSNDAVIEYGYGPGENTDVPGYAEPYRSDWNRPVRPLGNAGGKYVHTLREDQLPPHTHQLGRDLGKWAGQGTDLVTYQTMKQMGLYTWGSVRLSQEAGNDTNSSYSFNGGNGSGNQVRQFDPIVTGDADDYILPDSMKGHSHGNMPPFLVLDYIIKI